jgi:hypothetical protein
MLPTVPFSHHVRQHDEIRDTQRASAGGHHNERIHLAGVSPGPWQRTLHAVITKKKTRSSPQGLPHPDQIELPTGPGMKRMRHTDSPLPNGPIRRS